MWSRFENVACPSRMGILTFMLSCRPMVSFSFKFWNKNSANWSYLYLGLYVPCHSSLFSIIFSCWFPSCRGGLLDHERVLLVRIGTWISLLWLLGSVESFLWIHKNVPPRETYGFTVNLCQSFQSFIQCICDFKYEVILHLNRLINRHVNESRVTQIEISEKSKLPKCEPYLSPSRGLLHNSGKEIVLHCSKSNKLKIYKGRLTCD